ncbi:twin transmembrane helix small protein [Aquabacterium sp. A08]|uniref:twin transmembrane helix small protein n=1 Tax=Aquabacterium sp. A08 TaxID=2718532 RepID=UPI001422141A|nr:twin transmembrane helix small protein [Aquabacterium sp. A08]NIC41526.1 twin transmembrane helix small protein [Aquabacterium sp. A08]NIC42050.1 twin transmembrane helix small protein [Aquabacterium sp. A08]NIC42099.1 twin transmembrane helix small protein [Aquabacterium sp. A08]
MTYLVILAFVLIVGSLGVALVSMMRGHSNDANATKSRRMARALTVRIGLSVLLFIAVLVAYLMGWIQPTGLPLR